MTDIWIETTTTIWIKFMGSSASNGEHWAQWEEDVQRAVATALPKNLICPLPRAETREDVGFGAQ